MVETENDTGIHTYKHFLPMPHYDPNAMLSDPVFNFQNTPPSLNVNANTPFSFRTQALTFFFISVPGGTLNAPKIKPATATIPALPTL
jgi:hypothetical protein